MTGQLEVDLSSVSVEALVAELLRRVTSPAAMTADDTRPMTTASSVTDDTLSSVERQRARWRRSQAARRARLRAMTDDVSSPVVIVNTRNTTTTGHRSSVIGHRSGDDMLPGLEHAGPAPDPTPAPPDDIRRRKLRTDTAALLARHDLARQQAAGAEIRNPAGWLRTVTARITADRAAEIVDAVERAIARWPTPDAAHVVSLLTAPAARRVERPVDRSPLPPRDEVLAGLAGVRSALRRTA